MRMQERMREMLRPIAEERGVALVIALLSMILLSIMGVTFLSMSGTETMIASNAVNSSRAFYLTEAAVSLAKQTLRTSANWDNELAASPFTCPASIDGCSYQILNDAADPGGPTDDTNDTVLIRATGQIQSATRVIEVAVTQMANPSLFPNAVFGVLLVNISGDAELDSFDSRVGPYDPANPGSAGDAGSNGDIDLSGPSEVNGDATAGGTADIVAPATVTGTVTSGAPPVSVPPVTPCGPPWSDGTGLSGTYTYNPVDGQLVVDGDNITVANGTYCFSSIDMKGNSSLTPNGPVKINLTYQADFTGGSVVNTTANAANLAITSSFSGAGDGLTFSGDTQAYMTVYCPECKIDISGNSKIYGAIVGEVIVARGSTAIHYDEALGVSGGAGGGGWVFQVSSWKEVY